MTTATLESSAPSLAEDKSLRCDRRGAKALVRVTLKSGELLFCKHDATKHANVLQEIAISIQDESDRL